MHKPWLCVIIPSYNGERWLAAALQSIADQKDDGIEVIVIDTSAGEASINIASSFGDRLHICVERRPDLGPWTAKTNYAVERAGSDHICILH